MGLLGSAVRTGMDMLGSAMFHPLILSENAVSHNPNVNKSLSSSVNAHGSGQLNSTESAQLIPDATQLATTALSIPLNGPTPNNSTVNSTSNTPPTHT